MTTYAPVVGISIGESVAVTVDDSLTFQELLDQAGATLARRSAALELPLHSGKRELACFLVSPRTASPAAVRDFIIRRGTRPADLRELLCFAAQHESSIPRTGQPLVSLVTRSGSAKPQYPVLWFWRIGMIPYDYLKLGWRVNPRGNSGKISYLAVDEPPWES